MVDKPFTPQKHGFRYTKEYKTWAAIKNRCFCKTSKDFKRYGKLGISMHEGWVYDFMAFFNHIGFAPTKKHQVDRKDTRRGYIPGNVRWATPKEQAQNRTSSYKWQVKGLAFSSAQDAATHFGVTDVTIHKWVRGYFDKRRGTFSKPKEGCYAVPRY